MTNLYRIFAESVDTFEVHQGEKILKKYPNLYKTGAFIDIHGRFCVIMNKVEDFDLFIDCVGHPIRLSYSGITILDSGDYLYEDKEVPE